MCIRDRSKAKEDRTKEKAIFIDECWALLSTNELTANYIPVSYTHLGGVKMAEERQDTSPLDSTANAAMQTAKPAKQAKQLADSIKSAKNTAKGAQAASCLLYTYRCV